MHLPRHQRKLILFYARIKELSEKGEFYEGLRISLSERTPRYFTAIDFDDNEIDISEYHYESKIRKSALERQIDKAARLEFDKVVKQFFSKLRCIEEPISNPGGIGVFSFAKLIGIERPKARFILDLFHASNLPTFSSMTRSWAHGHKFVLDHGGLYHLYRYDQNRTTAKLNDGLRGVIVKATLSVRYPVPYRPANSQNKDNCRIRCKMNLGSYDLESPAVHKYDGFVSPRGNWWQWLFQSRKQADEPHNDVVLLYSRELKFKLGDAEAHEGLMLTQNQDDDWTPTCSRVIIIRDESFSVKSYPIFANFIGREREFGKVEKFYRLSRGDERKFMRETHDILSLESGSNSNAIDKLAIDWLFSNSNGNLGGFQL